MYTEIDNSRGFVRTSWDKISKRIHAVEPRFAELVDRLDPNFKTHPLYIAYFPYGESKGDTNDNFLPLVEGGVARLADPNINKTIKKDLGYGATSSPMGMIVDKCFEFYTEVTQTGRKSRDSFTYPWHIVKPGSVFPIGRLLRSSHNHSFAPNGLMSVSAGARSAFLLPSILSERDHYALEASLNQDIPFPHTFAEHWHVFKAMCQNKDKPTEWRASLIYFGENWVKDLYDNPNWAQLKLHLFEKMWHGTEFERSQTHYTLGFTKLQNNKSTKLDPFSLATATYLVNTALGVQNGFSPASDESCLPLKYLQSSFSSYYRISKEKPTIMIPKRFEHNTKNPSPVYYSLQHSMVEAYTTARPKSKTAANELANLAYVMRQLKKHFNENEMFTDTVYEHLHKEINFDYFHNQEYLGEKHLNISPSHALISQDRRFSPHLAGTAKFMRGAIRISSASTSKNDKKSRTKNNFII